MSETLGQLQAGVDNVGHSQAGLAGLIEEAIGLEDIK